MKTIYTLLFLAIVKLSSAQTKILFDATKAETAGSADWVIDADTHNLGYPSSNNGAATVGAGSESNAQRIPTPAQSGITASTAESYWKGALSYWGIDCVKHGYTVETLPYNGAITYGNTSNPQDLSNYKVFIVCEPNIVFTAAEKTAILQFVQNGGGLFMISDHNGSDRNNDGWDSPAIWNDLMTNNTIQSNPFGMTYDLVDINQTSTNVSTSSTDSLLHGPMGNVSKVTWSDGTTLTLQPSANPTVKASVCKTGTFGNTNVMVAFAHYGNGKVAAIGDSSPCDDGSGDTNDQLYDGYIADAAGNHQKLLLNATIWLATSNATLPVKLSRFSATASGSQGLIEWQNESESNIRQYDVQSGSNGVAFETIHTTAPMANNLGSAAYSYRDAGAKGTAVYYRLKLVERTGEVSYSQIQEVRFGGNGFTASLSANPVVTAGAINITLDEAMPVSITVVDALGKTHFTGNYNCGKGVQSIALSVAHLITGTYYARITAGNETKTLPFVKSRMQ